MTATSAAAPALAVDRTGSGLPLVLLHPLGADRREDALWGHALYYEGIAPARASRTRERTRTPVPLLAVPEWLGRPAPAEARPTNPLSPSSLGEDDAPDPPRPPITATTGPLGSSSPPDAAAADNAVTKSASSAGRFMTCWAPTEIAVCQSRA